MSSAAEHYGRHLGPIYVWMAGGTDAALQAGTAEIEALGLPVTQGERLIEMAGAELPVGCMCSYTTIFTSARRTAGKRESVTVASCGGHLNT